MNRKSSAAAVLLGATLANLALGCRSREPKGTPIVHFTGKLAGDFSAQATNPGGTGNYAADVRITAEAPYYSLTWRIGKDRSYGGIGLEVPAFLGVGWGIRDYRVFVYEVAGSHLRGQWASPSSKGALGSEELEGPSGLSGTYTIVDGFDPQRSRHYDGTVSIAPNGTMYRVQHSGFGDGAMSGIGMKKGGLLFVGASRGSGAGVMVYTLMGKNLSGQWAQPASNLLGTEFLTRR